MVDLTKFAKPATTSRPTDPREIFKRRPAGEGVANDLWQGQAETLREWHENPGKNSLVLLNTGAGKTYVGLLIAQSLVNQGKANVLYLCSTIDLVHQTEKEARRLGLTPTLRISGHFSSDDFEQGRTFCITTYHGALNSRSVFSSRFRPEAVVFDDAHVAERILRESFTLSISRDDRPALYESLCAILEDCFTSYDLKRRFRDLRKFQTDQALLAPPTSIFDQAERIENTLASNVREDDPDLLFPYEFLKDHIKFCTVFVNSHRIEISPPFLPSLTIQAIGGRNIQRVFLSATLDTRSDFARAFGRLPDQVVEPNVDAGNGERLILFADAFGDENEVNKVAARINTSAKMLIAVPSARRARRWKAFGTPPDRKHFSSALDKFRTDTQGSFVLVGRYDGIDLPGPTCRVMVLDGLPTGGTLLERYQFEHLYMDRSFLGRVANRLTQLFGRINRGRSDYGVFLIADKPLGNWLKNDRNRALLPELLRQQIFVGEDIQGQIGNKMSVDDGVDLAGQVLRRANGWLSFYEAHIGEKDVSPIRRTENEQAEAIYSRAARNEVIFMTKIWDGDLAGAREALENGLDSLPAEDPNLAGWYSIWVGITHYAEGNRETAIEHFDNARKRLGRPLPLPRAVGTSFLDEIQQSTVIGSGIASMVDGELISVNNRVSEYKRSAAPAFDASSSHKQAEEAVKTIGVGLGFTASRPCTEFGTGPDDIWIDEFTKGIIAFELKTDKGEDGHLSKADVGQAHDHIQWIADNYPDYTLHGLVFFTRAKQVTGASNASPLMHFGSPSTLQQVLNAYWQAVEQVRNRPPKERPHEAKKWGDLPEWKTGQIFQRICDAQLQGST